MKKKKKIIFSIIILFVIIFISYVVYFFFGGKRYTFYMKDAAMEIEAVQIYIDEDTDQKEDDKFILTYKTEVINDIIEELKKVKLKPNYSYSEVENSEKGFSVILLGENNQRLYYIASGGKNNYAVDIGMEENGVIDNGIKDLIYYTSIPKKQGEKLYNFFKDIVERNMCEISISDIEKMSKEKIHDWNQFQQYVFTEIEAGEITRNGLTSTGTAKFLIAEKKDIWRFGF